MNVEPLIGLIFSMVLSYIFVVAAVHKWKDLGEFQETLANYQVIPTFLVKPFSFAMPMVELFAGVGILVPAITNLSALVIALLLLTYMTAMSLNLVKGRRSIDCGCGGGDQKQNISEWLVLRNAVLVFFAWCVMSNNPVREFIWFDWLVAFLATTVICLIYNILNQLLVNRDLLKVFKSHA